MSIRSTGTSVSSRHDLLPEPAYIFQDAPLIDRNVRLTVIETKNSDKQIVNELVYRWCRKITQISKRYLDRSAGPSDTISQDCRKVLILDLIGSVNPVRFGTVMRRDEKGMRMIGISRGCRINATFVTLSSYLATAPSSLKLLVIYQDEYFIMKTLNLLKDFARTHAKCQVLLVVPRLDRRESDYLNLNSPNQVIRCDFSVNRREIGPAPPDSTNEAYHVYLNQVVFRRISSTKKLPDKVEGELREDGLHLKSGKDNDSSNTLPPEKRIKTAN